MCSGHQGHRRGRGRERTSALEVVPQTRKAVSGLCFMSKTECIVGMRVCVCVLSVAGGQDVHSSESTGPVFVFRKCERVPRTWTS